MDAPPIDVAGDPRWARIVARDATADGALWYSVTTTGIYCRPSCPSRRPHPRHVRLHDTLAAARAGGARPCRRCNPDGSGAAAENAALVERLCRLLDTAGPTSGLAALADAAELSPGHLQRLFKATVGLTPRAYAAALRRERVRGGLAAGRPVTQAIHDAGYGSAARFYAEAEATLGMAPARYRQGGAGETLCVAGGRCRLGVVLVAISAVGVAAILLGDDRDALMADLARRFPRAMLVPAAAGEEATLAAVVAQVDAPGTAVDLPLDIRGTAFQQRVWQALRRVPAGTTASYAAIAGAIGAPTATRAVAAACGANPLAVAIPCHRVVRADGGLSGYRWGLARKRALIAAEADGVAGARKDGDGGA